MDKVSSRTVLFIFQVFLLPTCVEAVKQPHILYILADDLAWRDVNWNAEDMYTPNLDRLRQEGVELTNHYMHPTDGTSRVAFLTGYYPFRLGQQKKQGGTWHYYRWTNNSLPLDYKILPEYLQWQGYNTHLVGKWGMGFCNWDMTPTQRGFNTFYGSYGGNTGHFNHTPKVNGYDLRDNLNVDWSANGSYSTTLYTQRTVDIIKNHYNCNDRRPLFIYLAFEAPHTPIEAPQSYIDLFCGNISDPDRRVRCGMMAALDEGVGLMVEAMEEVGYDDNFLIVFSSDNGGPGRNGASNWPLRGKKRSGYEGGIRVPTFLYSKTLLPKSPYAYNGLLHVTDWLPTLLRVAGVCDVDSVLPSDRDGFDQWHSIKRKVASVRRRVVLDMDLDTESGAVRIDQWKLVKDPEEKCLGWFNPPSTAGPSGGPRKLFCGDYQLFDISTDPNERQDLAAIKPKKFLKLMEFYNDTKALVSPPPYAENLTASYPENWEGAWSPGWC